MESSSHIKPGMGEEINGDMNRDKHLLLDSRVIKSTENAKLTLGTVKKHPANPLFGEDKPWEPRFDNLYPNVIYDEEDELYKCWYNPFIVFRAHTLIPRDSRKYMDLAKTEDAIEGECREMGLCYAVSKDGIHWEKPELGIVEFDGSKKNNIVMRSPHGPGVFKDLREPDPARRYKTFFGGKAKMEVAFSPDGLHWSQPITIPEVNSHGTHANAVWAPDLGKYAGFTRQFSEPSPGVRQVWRTESSDFVHWTRDKVVLSGLDRNLQTYSMPVFCHGGVYLGLVAIYDTDADRVWTELTWSPDTATWHRVLPGMPLIPNSEKEGEYDWGCVYAAACPVFLEDEIRLYYGGSDGYHFGWRDGFFCLATLRPDGFAGYEPTSTDAPAIIVTKPITGQFASLCITADVQVGGSVRVAAVDEQGKELAHGEPINSTVTDGKVTWTDGWDLASVNGKEIRLKFELNDTKLYSFQFQGR